MPQINNIIEFTGIYNQLVGTIPQAATARLPSLVGGWRGVWILRFTNFKGKFDFFQ